MIRRSRIPGDLYTANMGPGRSRVPGLLWPANLVSFSPLDIANCETWSRGDMGVAGDPVDNWANNGALGNDFAQALTKRPTVSTLNGQASILYDDSNDSLVYSGGIADHNFLHDGTGGTLVVIFKATADGTIADSSRTNNPARVGITSAQSAGSVSVAVNNGLGVAAVFSVSFAQALNTPCVLVVRCETGHATDDYDVRANGVQKANGAFAQAAAAGNPNGGITLGEVSGAGVPIGGEIPEVIAYSRYLVPAEVTQIEAYATARYGL